MQYYLRPECYADPSRQSSVPIHADIALNGPPSYGYGDPIRVGDDADAPDTWPLYYVANFPHLSQIDDPATPGAKAMLVRLLLARAEEWDQFDMPDNVRDALQANQNGLNRVV